MLDILNPANERTAHLWRRWPISCAGEEIAATRLKPWMDHALVQRVAIKNNRLAVRGRPRRAVPGFLAGGEFVGAGDLLLGHHVLKRGQPVPVIGLPGIGVAR